MSRGSFLITIRLLIIVKIINLIEQDIPRESAIFKKIKGDDVI